MGTVRYSALEADRGFSTEAFRADDFGNLVVDSIDATEILLGGSVIFTTAGAGTTTLVSSIVDSNLQTLGTLSGLNVEGSVSVTGDTTVTGPVGITGNFSATGGVIHLVSTSPQSYIDNIRIGSVTPATGAFTTLTANSNVTLSPTGTVQISPTGTIEMSPTQVGSIDNVDIGTTVPALGNFNAITLTAEATATNQVPTKNYVDKRSVALSIALGT